MKKYLALLLFPVAGMVSTGVYAVPGEFWEITSTIEMRGMPMAMPAQTMKVCMPKDRNLDFQKMNQDKDCKVTNVKRSANKASYDITCNHDGEIMKGTAEFTLHGDTQEGSTRFTGKSNGHDMNMTQKSKGKLVGGNCDTEVEVKKANDKMNANKAYADKMMQDSKSNTAALCAKGEKDYGWVTVPDYFFGERPTCPGKTAHLCESLRKDISKDVKVYAKVAYSEQQQGKQISVAKECKIDMAAANKSVCKTPVNEGNYESFSKYCPREAKAFREIQRRKNCEGRSYTGVSSAEGMKRCMSGDEGGNTSDSRNSDNANSSEKPGQDGASSAKDSATKLLKGYLGF
jgi:hypothetical protein